MSSETGPEAMFEKATKEETKYQWLDAAKSYEGLLLSKEVSFCSDAEIRQKIALCYTQASQQTNDQEQFRKLRQNAANAYKNAGKSFEKEDSPEAKGKSERCYLLSRYVSSWLAPNSSEKRRILEDCCVLGQESLKALEKSGDELGCGRIFNDLLQCILDRLYIARNSEEMNSIAQEGIECVNKAVIVLSRIRKKDELLRFYSLSSLASWYVSNFVEKEEKAQKEHAQRSLDCSEKALALSQEVNDSYLTALSDWAAALCAIAFTENAESALEYANEMLKQGTIAKDNYLKGIAFYLLAFVTDMITLREADPDKKKEGHRKTISYSEEALLLLSLVSQYGFMAGTYLYYAEGHAALASFLDISLEERRAMLKKAVEIGRKGLECAIISGSPEAELSTLHILSKALYSYSNTITGTHQRRKLLEEALEKRMEYGKVIERVFPSMDWIRGVGKNYEALLKVELARLEKLDTTKKTDLFRSAVSDMEDSISHCKKWIKSHPMPSHIAAIAGFESSFGEMLVELYSLTEDKEILASANEIHDDAATQFKKVDLPSRAAESYWRIARNQDHLGDRQKASRNFECASECYSEAAKRIPQLEDLYQDYSSYTLAWSEIEKARYHHLRQEYGLAKEHFEKAASLHNSSKRWSYLSSNYSAWAQVELAEDLSRKDQSEQAIRGFEQAAKMFKDSKDSLQTKLSEMENPDEKQMAESLTKAAGQRHEYCAGRIAIEEAKILDKKGDHYSSSEKYGSAAKTFEQLTENAESEESRKELKLIVTLSKAWQKMVQAEAEASPRFYAEASQLFEEAKDLSPNEKAKMLALGHSRFCKALEVGVNFSDTRESAMHTVATQYLESAASYYIKAGSPNASEYAKATGLLFDACLYMDNARKETDPEKKAKQCMMAEKVLEKSAGSFIKAEHIEKHEQTLKLMDEVQEERELALSLTEILHAPSIASSTKSFTTPTSTNEEAIGLERFEHADVHANVVVGTKELKVGEDLDLEIELVNAGKGPAVLNKITDVVPQGFKLKERPDIYRVEDSHLDMKGKRLDPLITEEVRLILKTKAQGTFILKPTVLYLDENGRCKSYEPEPTTITVKELGIKGWLKGER